MSTERPARERGDVERADELVDGASERAERFARQVAEFTARAAARAREEAEDLLAEARAVRHGERRHHEEV